MKFVREPKSKALNVVKNGFYNRLCLNLAVLKKTGHWYEIIEAINTVELSAEHEKLVIATTKNAITQASKQLYINFEKPAKKYNEDDEQGKGV